MASVQEMVRPGEALDLYYYSSETSKKQAFATTQNTKYVQELSNKSGGSSVFLFPPQNGVQDIVVSMSFAAPGANANLALPSGWAYGLVRSVSFRYAGTSQYLLTGDQLLQNALRDQTNRSSCDDLVNIGGNYASGTDLDNSQTATIVLRLPHASASGVNKMLPFPSDCITQQIQVILELNPVSSIWTNLGGALPAACTTLSSAYFQVQQVMFNNMGDSLARRVDLSTKAYAFPVEFVQQKVAINLQNSTAPQTVVLSGFRAGSVKSLQMWLTDNSDQQTSSSGSATGWNVNNWYVPSSVECVYAGDIYARYNNGTGQLFNLLNSNKAPCFDLANVSVGAGAINPPLPFLSQWLELPFAQALCDEDSHYILVHGKAITNGIINLNNLVVPYVSVGTGAGWTLNISYVYSATLLFSQGSCDYVF